MATVEKHIFDFFIDSIYYYLNHDVFGNVNEAFLREIEEHIGIPESDADDFRRQIHQFATCYGLKWDTTPQLKAAILAYAKKPISDYPAALRNMKRTIDDTWEGT